MGVPVIDGARASGLSITPNKGQTPGHTGSGGALFPNIEPCRESEFITNLDHDISCLDRSVSGMFFFYDTGMQSKMAYSL